MILAVNEQSDLMAHQDEDKGERNSRKPIMGIALKTLPSCCSVCLLGHPSKQYLRGQFKEITIGLFIKLLRGKAWWNDNNSIYLILKTGHIKIKINMRQVAKPEGWSREGSLSAPGLTTCACMLRHFSRVRLFATLWTVALQAPLFMGFSRLEYWSGLLCPPPEDLPDPGIEPTSLMSPVLAGRSFTTNATTWEIHFLEKCRSWMSAKLDSLDAQRDPLLGFRAFQGFTQTTDTLQKLKLHWRETFP